MWLRLFAASWKKWVSKWRKNQTKRDGQPYNGQWAYLDRGPFLSVSGAWGRYPATRLQGIDCWP
jgi:hypothetical protein